MGHGEVSLLTPIPSPPLKKAFEILKSSLESAHSFETKTGVAVLKKISVLAIVVAALMVVLPGCNKAKRSGFRADNAAVESSRSTL